MSRFAKMQQLLQAAVTGWAQLKAFQYRKVRIEIL
jgi:hypothetical protein